MGAMINLTAADGHVFAAYQASPRGKARGGLVIIQEIFGVTAQMKRCADRFAEAGYLSLVPALFDRQERGLTLTYKDFQKGGSTARSIPEEQILADVEAARHEALSAGAVAIIGYCWGGTIAYLAASRLPFGCAVSYYGGGIGELAGRMHPNIPVMYHFGAADRFIPMTTIDKIRRADSNGVFHVYDGADHGFNCDDRESYHAEASRLSEERTLDFLSRHL
jgi:carboxymethylenebutenolidase